MSGVSFTPGPWHLHQQGSMRACDGRHDTLDGCRTIAEAEIIGVERAEAEANARLIAAAPDLYAALKALLEWVGGDAEYTDMDLSKRCSMAKLALAKAEGK